MSELTGLLNNLRARLGGAGVPFVVGGSFALAARGAPRGTDDIDIMVLVSGGDLTPVHHALLAPPQRYFMVNEVNFRDTESVLLIDVIPVRDEAQEWAFRAAGPARLHGADVTALSAEGVAVMLLREATQGDQRRRHRRLGDLVDLADANPGLDWTTVASWARRMGYELAYEEWDAPGKPPL